MFFQDRENGGRIITLGFLLLSVNTISSIRKGGGIVINLLKGLTVFLFALTGVAYAMECSFSYWGLVVAVFCQFLVAFIALLKE